MAILHIFIIKYYPKVLLIYYPKFIFVVIYLFSNYYEKFFNEYLYLKIILMFEINSDNNIIIIIYSILLKVWSLFSPHYILFASEMW